MRPSVQIKNITFSDGTAVTLRPNDVLLIVGPNNTGKSQGLRGILAKAYKADQLNGVIIGVEFECHGSEIDILNRLEELGKRSGTGKDAMYHVLGNELNYSNIHWWWTSGQGFGHLTRVFFLLLDAEKRLATANPAETFDFSVKPATNPIHFLLENDTFEYLVSEEFRKAFGMDLVVYRGGSNPIPLLVGERPALRPGEDRASASYLSRVRQMLPLHKQGDGMRAFVGMMLHLTLGVESVLLIDEPEAFLHPPQANLIGKKFCAPASSDRQIIVATHSSDVLRGALTGGSDRTRVVRITRQGDINVARELDNNEIAQFWADPLLRHSNILDGLFHDHVVICEGDADCRFYSAMAEVHFALCPCKGRTPDILFVHTSGKERFPVVIRALKKIEVPTSCILDFDALKEENLLSEIVKVMGGCWDSFQSDWQIVRSAVNDKKPELNASEVRKEIEGELRSVPETAVAFPEHIRRSIQRILKKGAPWQLAKGAGISYLPGGGPYEACRRLIDGLSSLGIHMVPVGELESFFKPCGLHGPAWVNETLKARLKSDSELQEARGFIASVLEGSLNARE